MPGILGYCRSPNRPRPAPCGRGPGADRGGGAARRHHRRLARRDRRDKDDSLPREYASNNPFGDAGRLIRTLRAKTLHFSHMDAWMDFARTCDLSFGMRIHGTMLPLQSGVPSVLVAHDSRTIGLADKMGIPWVSPEDFVSRHLENPVGLLTAIAAQLADYDSARKILAGTMQSYVRDNGLTPTPALEDLAAHA